MQTHNIPCAPLDRERGAPVSSLGHKHTFFCGGLLRAMTGLPVFLKIGFSARFRSRLTRSSCSANAAAAFCSRASCRRSLSRAFSASATCSVGQGQWRQVGSSPVKLLRVCVDHPTADAGGSGAAHLCLGQGRDCGQALLQPDLNAGQHRQCGQTDVWLKATPAQTVRRFEVTLT